MRGTTDTGSRPGPAGIQTSAGYVAALRQLKEWSALTYRQLSKRAEHNGDVLPRSTLAAVLGREVLPRAELVAAFVRACSGEPEEVGEWLSVRQRLAVVAVTMPEVVGAGPVGGGPVGEAVAGGQPATGGDSGEPLLFAALVEESAALVSAPVPVPAAARVPVPAVPARVAVEPDLWSARADPRIEESSFWQGFEHSREPGFWAPEPRRSAGPARPGASVGTQTTVVVEPDSRRTPERFPTVDVESGRHRRPKTPVLVLEERPASVLGRAAFAITPPALRGVGFAARFICAVIAVLMVVGTAAALSRDLRDRGVGDNRPSVAATSDESEPEPGVEPEPEGSATPGPQPQPTRSVPPVVVPPPPRVTPPRSTARATPPRTTPPVLPPGEEDPE